MDYVTRTPIVLCSDKSFGTNLNFSPHFQRSTEIMHCSTPDAVLSMLEGLPSATWVFFTFWSSYIPSSVYLNHRAVVFHMTDLPFGRGGTPLQNLIQRGFSSTMLSALQCVKELDAGPVYLKKEMSLEGSASQIFARAEELMPQMIEEIVVSGKVPIEQVGEVVQFRRRTPEMSKLSNADPLNKLYDNIRMVDAEGYPRAYIDWAQYRIEFSNADFANETLTGTFVIRKNGQD